MASNSDIDTVLSGANAPFISELYAQYLENPGSVDASWQSIFGELGDINGTAIEGPSWATSRTRVIGVPDPEAVAKPAKGKNGQATGGVSPEQVKASAIDSIRALMIIRAYRARGHLLATLDPLGLAGTRFNHPELDPAHFGFTEADWDRPIYLNNVLGRETATLREIMSILRDTYCGNIGVEYTHISDPARKAWLQERIEGIRNQTDFTENGKKAILERLTAAESFERFLHVKYTGTKRFGLDGGEAAIPALEQIVKRGGQLGVQEIVIGMAHRGRLNVLTNFMGKPFRAVFSEFQGNPANPSDVQGSGDVKYHLGTSTDREFDGKKVHLSLTANPSHLEVVDAVVLGKVRAKQTQLKDTDRRKVLGLLIHGDAAFAGQGIVAECFGMSELKGYRTGGTIHLIINNQIGFTTSPAYSRSSPYPSDVAKMVEAPIFHVNGDDAEAVVHATRVATEYRQEFGVDVVIDIFCYRRFGHNEGDEPAYTQPLMYQAIGQHPSVRKLYAQRLVEEKLLTQDEADQVEKDFMAHLEDEFQVANSYKPNKADWLEGAWSGMETASGDDRRGETAVPLEKLREIGLKLCEMPEGLDVNRKLVRQLEDRKKRLEAGENLDWGTGEALAFGTLLTEGYPVRLSGQDSGRGTFSHRHAVVIDQTTEERYVPLANLSETQAQFEVIDSPLAEMSVLGFEYGYTLTEPRALVLWEAQFGDFTNGAQVVIDQFISSGENKWLRMSGLVMLLPHGYEGQGPEHSSARLERYLQQCAEDNMQVVNVTTPANYFHVLRRQLHRKFRKPLVIMTPKSLLRHKLAVSSLADMAEGTTFHRVLYDNEILCDDKDVKRVVLCSGKVYYDLYEERAKRGLKDVFFLRLEQLYPFPHKALADELKRFPKAEVVWCQEEPENMGSWTFVDRRIEAVLIEVGAKQKRPVYVGRPAAAATATGLLKRHNLEQAKLVDEALSGKI
ncbi:MAG: 2-oxoglutarate dehydrogenase E1 component [Alphaproteobacteria bacterium]|nr:2-oxoglutarate dehydrogenase E1 component [Alphaproteobacteria bacterium]MBU0796446.1 2-oxoglutarate dehydrogenase E1 component [Alphaproteobacteria bacterium]MBU0888668.1 2-oxoglutarate dehydrogenase E1 component [Alphaproteobacteria bacterium]MBU1813598.1 2-oxoglutarate dehydrogenase E1 component [Alphaproteobacteria bacterium]